MLTEQTEPNIQECRVNKNGTVGKENGVYHMSTYVSARSDCQGLMPGQHPGISTKYLNNLNFGETNSFSLRKLKHYQSKLFFFPSEKTSTLESTLE